MQDHEPTFAELGTPFPLFDAYATEATKFVPDTLCSLCGATRPVCFELGIGSDVVLQCGSCGEDNGLDAADRCDKSCHRCGREVVFPPFPDEQLTCCYACLRSGKAAMTKDTELGMISFDQVREGLTNGIPGLQSTEFEIVPSEEAGWNRARLPREVMLELLRTPTYRTIQGDRWRICCRAPMIFVGSWSRAEFTARAPDGDGQKYFTEIVQDVVPGLWEDQLHDVTRVYVFRCASCQRHRAHWDMA